MNKYELTDTARAIIEEGKIQPKTLYIDRKTAEAYIQAANSVCQGDPFDIAYRKYLTTPIIPTPKTV